MSKKYKTIKDLPVGTVVKMDDDKVGYVSKQLFHGYRGGSFTTEIIKITKTIQDLEQ